MQFAGVEESCLEEEDYVSCVLQLSRSEDAVKELFAIRGRCMQCICA